MEAVDKAFISHSSKDKGLAQRIADELGPLRCEYDEYSFDFILNSEAIRRALSRCSLFVLLLSENSVSSAFVQEEVRAALERRASGAVRQIVIFAIDQTSYQSLPQWLRDVNVAQHLKTDKQIARRIDAYITELSLSRGRVDDYYLGRSEQEKELSKILSRPKRSVPIALHVIGNHGVGRKTFLRKTLHALAPRQYTTPIEITLNEFDGIIEFYRKLYEYNEVSNYLVAGERFAAFNAMTTLDKCKEISTQIKLLCDSDCLLMVIDDGGVYQNSGDYKEYFPDTIRMLEGLGRPAIAFIQTRMMREIFKSKYQRSAHIRIPSLSDDVVYELMCLLLNEFDVDYTEEEAKQACALTDGHPYNIHFIAAYIKGEGIDVALSDPGEIIEIKYQIGNNYIRSVAFSELEADIICILHDYRFCEMEFVLLALGESGANVGEALRRLEDHCCIERRDRILMISPPLRDAIRRDKRFSRDSIWKAAVAGRVIGGLETYRAEDSLPFSLIDAALPDLIRSGKATHFISSLILPSHFLRVARDYYDRSNWNRCVEFCRKALELEAQLSMDARVETNRLIGLSLTRINPENTEIERVVSSLLNIGTSTAKRVAYFIEGFRHRRRGNYDEAEQKFLKAWELERDNFHINRELCSVLCRMERYSEAEPYARAVYRRYEDNPYILDVLIEAIEGKASQGLHVDAAELRSLYEKLRSACETGGFQFFEIREARRLYADGHEKAKAFKQIEQLISKTKDNGDALFYRGEMYVRSSNFRKAREDIKNLKEINSGEARYHAKILEVYCLIAENQFVEAKRYLDHNFSSAPRSAKPLEKRLAKAIAFAPNGQPDWLLAWAKTISS